MPVLPIAIDLSLPLSAPVAVMSVVLLVMLAAPLVARRGIPGTVVLLAAGIALGPHAFGVLDRDPTMVLLGTIGLLYIMFLAGLEIDLHEFQRHRNRSLIFGSLTFILPQSLGALVGRLGFGLGWPAAILFGSIFASHTLLAYPAVARMGVQKLNAVTTAVGATILTDTLALLVLAVVATGARAGGDANLLLVFFQVSGSLLLFGGALLWGLPRVGAWFLRTAASEPALEFVFVLLCVFIAALGVELLGIEAIIGAFLAGLGLNRLVPEGGALMQRITFTGNALFIPFFLLSTGMLVDLSAFAGGPDAGRAWAVAVAMSATVFATKGAAAWLQRPAFGYSRDEALIGFGLTIPQAAATIAAVVVGVEVGLLDGAVLNGTIAMVFLTCLAGPWIAEGAARRLAAVEAERVAEAPESAQRLLLSLANPATVEPLVDLGLLLRESASDEPLTAVTIVPGGADQALQVLRGEQTLARAVEVASGVGVGVTPLVRVEPNVARGLARAAAETRASTLVMGWDGAAAAERLLFGTVPDRVLAETTAAVLIARTAGPLALARRIVLVVPPLADLEPGFADAVRLLGGLAERASLRVLLVTPERAQASIAAAVERARPGLPLSTAPIGGWAEVPPRLDALLGTGDVLALVAARQGSVAWQTSLDRLPRLLARRHAERPLLVLYPGQVPVSERLSAALSSGERALLDRLLPETVALGLSDGTTDTLARSVRLEQPAPVAAALRRAPADARRAPAPGAWLVHGHDDALEAPAVLVGVSRAGVTVEGAEGPVHVLIALVSPAHVPAQQQAAWHALVARMAGSAEAVARVREASTPEAARDALLASLNPGAGGTLPLRVPPHSLPG